MPVAQLFLDARGITGEQGPTRLKAGDLSTAENVSYFNLLQKEGGATRVNPANLSGGVRAGFDWWPQPNTQRRIVATADGKILKDDMTGAFATTLKSGLAADRVIGIMDGGSESAGSPRKLFITNGFDPPQVVNADLGTTTDLATPAADWNVLNHYQPAGMFLFRGVPLAFGNENRLHALYGALGSNNEDFASAGTFILNVYPGQGERIAAGITAIGRGFVFKYPQNIYYIDDSASTISGWFILPITSTYGVPLTPHAVTQVDQSTVAFLNSDGAPIFMQETFATITGVNFVDLFKALNFTERARELFDPNQMHRSQLRWDSEKKTLHATYAALGDTSQTRRMTIDFNNERTRVEVSTLCGADAIWMERTGAIQGPMAGDAAGVVRKLRQDVRSVDGVPYTMRVRTAATDYSDQDPSYVQKKTFSALHLEYIPTGTFDLTARHYIDGQQQPDVVFPLKGTGRAPRRISRDIGGEGFYHEVEFEDSGPNNPKISRAWVEFETAGMAAPIGPV